MCRFRRLRGLRWLRVTYLRLGSVLGGLGVSLCCCVVVEWAIGIVQMLLSLVVRGWFFFKKNMG